MKKKTTEQFIIDAYCKHGDRYNYKLVNYKGSNIKVKIICHIHGIFDKSPNHHLKGQGCPKCSVINDNNRKRKTTEQFIIDAYCKHGDKYNYKLVQYKNKNTKIKIICPVHGIFEQKPTYHLSGRGCPKCGRIKQGPKKKTIEQFIKKAIDVHGNKYDYSLVQYKNSSTKIKIICPIHGIFEQKPNYHVNNKYGCPKCAILKRINKQKLTTEQFIKKAIEIHGNKYEYSLVDYKDAHTKVKIICKKHGIFEQKPTDHANNKNGCPKCAGQYKEQYTKNNIPIYDTYAKQLEPYGIKCRRNETDKNILEVKCMYCDRWHIPSINSVRSKIQCIKNINQGESNLYCSDECKHACPTYGQILYPKNFKINTSREVQPQLRKLVFERDDYTCQKCFATDVELHCHHYEGIEVNPIESADIDNCITLCKKCHNEIHKTNKCGIKDYKREKC